MRLISIEVYKNRKLTEILEKERKKIKKGKYASD